MIQTTHVLERTSPFGEKFVGECILCGAEGLTMAQANEQCPNPAAVSEERAILLAMGPQPTEEEG